VSLTSSGPAAVTVTDMAHKKTWDFSDAPIVSRAEARSLGLKQFFTGAACAQGHVAPRYVRRANCVQCGLEHVVAWQKKMIYGDTGSIREYRRDLHLKNPLNALFRVSKCRAKKKGYEFTISKADISIPDNCPCCDAKIAVRSGALKCGPAPESPSLDRIDSRLGYVPGNVAVICWRCNELKRNASLDELRKIVAWLEQYEGKRARLSLVS
jgi:hypothetical protein